MISKKYLDKMYHRLYERKMIRASAKDKAKKKEMDEAILAIQMSIADYIETHQEPRRVAELLAVE